MLIACKCLNIFLNATASSNCDANENSIELNFLLQQQRQSTRDNDGDNHLQQFFEKAIGPLTQVKIQFQQIDLIQEIQIDQWTLILCLCCDTVTHAFKKDTELFLLNSLFLTKEEEINSLKANDNFSQNFGILLSAALRCSATASINDSNITFNIENKAKFLTQHYRNIVKNEIEAADERMRLFSEQQFAMLKQFREKAEDEYNVLLRLIKNVPESITTNQINVDGIANTKVANLETPPATPENIPMSIGNSPILKNPPELIPKNLPFNKSALKNLSRYSNTIIQPTGGSKVDNSVDAEFFFEMDGINSEKFMPSTNISDVDESDSDDSEATADGINIPRQPNRPKSLNIAHSLPVTVPTLSERTSIDDDFDEYANADDIAASIKALAKSVHGDAVFGELPRPRFSTQI